jgi:hypothetical protein
MYGVSLNPENEILPLMGSKEGIFHISAALLNPGDRVLVPNPGYPTYASVARLLDADPVYYNLRPQNGWQPDLEEINQLGLKSIKIMWLNTPHMPTGVSYPEGLLKEMISLAHEHDFLIINDNPYSFVLNDQPKSLLGLPGSKEVCLELNSLSKSHHMPGWRLGWIGGNRQGIQLALQVKSNLDSGMFRALQLAAVKALDTPESWHQEQNAIYARRKSRVIQLMKTMGCDILSDTSGMFVWVAVPSSYASAEHLSEQLLKEAHVFIPPGNIFGSNGERYLRASLCVDESVIGQALGRIEQLKALIHES